MVRIVVDFLIDAAALYDQGHYREALLVLEQAELSKARETTAVDLSELHYLYAKCCYRLGDFEKSLVKVKEALNLSAKTIEHSLFAREKQLLGTVYKEMGQLDDAIEAFLEAYTSHKRAGDDNRVYASLVNLGLAHFAKGDIRQALNITRKATAFAVQHNTECEVRMCQRNLSRIALFAGEFKQCEDLLELVSRNVADSIDKARFHELLGMSRVFLLDSFNAHRALNGAFAQYRDSGLQRESAVCLEYLGLNEYFQGNYVKAKEYYQQVLDMPEPTASAVAQTLRMLTDVQIAEGDFARAKETAARAEEAINKISERIELGALYRCYGQIYGHDGVRDRAHDYFVKSIDLLRELGAKYELALSYLAAGRSACYNDAVRLEHLHQAKVLFAEMDVPKRMAQVGEEIKKLVGARRAVPAIHTPNPSREGNKKAKGAPPLTVGNPGAPPLGAGKPGAPPLAVGNVPTIITQNKRMQEILSLVDRIKNSDKTILITGETGTGKDLLAEYIHNSSDRAGKPYKVVNCANVPEHLWEAELFGSRRGSYTGALNDSLGLIRSADGGTFCFDEIGEIPLHLQAKLLRVIETRRFRRVGGHSDTPVDVRFIALTNRDLREMMTEGTFRADLYHRLQRFPLHLPPLRDRREDFLPLLRHFLKGSSYGAVSEPSLLPLAERLGEYHWPGNVRELQVVVERSLTLVAGDDWEGFRQAVLAQLKLVESDSLTKDRLLETLRRHGGNQSKAAEELGIPRTTLQSKMQRYGLK